MTTAKVKAKNLKPVFEECVDSDAATSASLSGDECTHSVAKSAPGSSSGSVLSSSDRQESLFAFRTGRSSHFSKEPSESSGVHALSPPAAPESLAEKFRHSALKMKDDINRRMGERVRALAVHNKWLEEKRDPTWQPGEPHFPVGLGFYLTNDFVKQQDPYLMKVYENIVALPDESVKDQLFCVLDDFRRLREIIKSSENKRSEYLKEVSRWACETRLTDITDENWPVEKALERETQLKDSYVNVLSAMCRLCELKQEMGYIPKARQVKKRPNSHLPDTEDSEPIVVHPMARDILRLLREAKQNESSYISEAEEKVDGLISFLADQEGAVSRARGTVQNKKSDLSTVKMLHEQNQQAVAQMLARIKELEQLPAGEEAKEPNVVRKTNEITPTLEAGVQTEQENGGAEGEESPTKPARQPPPIFLPPETNEESQRTIPEPCDDQVEQRPSVTKMKSDSKISEAKTSVSQQRLLASPASVVKTSRDTKTKPHAPHPDTLGKEQWETLSSEEETDVDLLRVLEDELDDFQQKIRDGRLMEFAKVVPPKSLDELEENKRKLSEKRKSRSEGIKKDSITVAAASFGPVAEEDPEIIAKMLRSFNYVISNNQKLLMSLLENFCQESDAEIKRIEVLEQTVKCTKDNLTSVIEKIRNPTTIFPSVEIAEAKAEVKNRTPLPHTCRYCECHLCKKDSILDTEEAAKALRKTLAFCTQYSLLLSNVKKRYSSMTQQLADTRALLEAQLKTMSSPGYTKTALGSLLPVTGDPVPVFSDQSVDSSGANLQDRMKSARSLVRVASDRAGQLVKIFQSVRLRWQDLQQQSSSLDDAQKQLECVQGVLNVTALDVTRLRSSQRVLEMGKHLQDMRCRYCQCYLSPFPEGLRGELAERFGAAASGQLKKALFSALSHLQQGQKAVLAAVEQEDNLQPWRCVSGVPADALLLMGEARDSVTKCLDLNNGAASGAKRKRSNNKKDQFRGYLWANKEKNNYII